MGNVFNQFGQFVEEFRYIRQGEAVPAGWFPLKFSSPEGTSEVVFAVKFQESVVPLIKIFLSFL